MSRVGLDGSRGSLRWFYRDSEPGNDLYQVAGVVDSEFHRTFQFRLTNFSMPMCAVLGGAAESGGLSQVTSPNYTAGMAREET